MFWTRVSLVSALAALGLAQDEPNEGNQYTTDTSPGVAPSTDCKPFHIFVARGSDEPYPGRAHKLLARLCTDSDAELHGDGCGYEDIVYPANPSADGKDAWCLSATKGAEAGQRQMADYAKRCPNSSLLLVGYSQGAAVVGDILGGTGGPIWECVQPERPGLKRAEVPGSKVTGVLMFGSVKHTANETYNVGGASHLDGVRARTGEHLEGLRQYASITRDYCNSGDPICAVETEDAEGKHHWNYFELYTNETTEWLASTALKERVSQLANAQESSASSSVAAASSIFLSVLGVAAVSLFSLFS
ncbi:hypothetical protein RB595_008201 [Gaeumannomyces hyphopodioides]